MSVLDHMCPKCDYYMPLGGSADTGVEGDDAVKAGDLMRYCRNCGHNQEEKKGLVMETIIQEKASDAYRVFLNEFTKQDPRLPHSKTIKCPNKACPSATGGVEPDTIYIKYDQTNLKFLYICNIAGCGTQWRSRS